ncbi:hypothetical protein MPSEU_000718100 [Mayamaea pseudoterrestris]|nr:hypothetical protein MPSEU_000718100 [Mayamaea pseudoterrestris]
MSITPPKVPLVKTLLRQSGTAKSTGNKAIPYGICWSNDVLIQRNDSKRSVYRYLASVAGRYVTILRTKVHFDMCSPKDGTHSESFKVSQSYLDPNHDEDLYCCVFAGECQAQPSFLIDESMTEIMPIDNGGEDDCVFAYEAYRSLPPAKRKKPSDYQPSTRTSNGNANSSCQLLCVAGKCGFVKIIDTRKRILLHSLRCLDEIWDLQKSPANEWLIVGASKDTTARIWNLEDGGSLVYILGGHGGHRDAVIAASWHSSGEWVATTGIDTKVNVWNVGRCTQKVFDNKSSSLTFALGRSRDFACERQHEPAFSTELIHNCAVDALCFVGNCIISKSCDESIELWLPRGLFGDEAIASETIKTEYKHVRHFRIPFEHRLWYVKFAVDPLCRLLAAGNDKGEVHVWEIFNGTTEGPRQVLTTCPTRQPSCIRDVKFSCDGTTLAATNDSGTVTKWDLIDLQHLWKPERL